MHPRARSDLIGSDRRSNSLFSRASFPKTVSHFSGCALKYIPLRFSRNTIFVSSSPESQSPPRTFFTRALLTSLSSATPLTLRCGAKRSLEGRGPDGTATATLVFHRHSSPPSILRDGPAGLLRMRIEKIKTPPKRGFLYSSG